MYVYAQPIKSIHSSVGTVGGALGCGDLYLCTVIAHLFPFRYALYGYGYIDGT